MLCTCINMACVTSDMSHTSSDGILVLRTGALEPGPLKPDGGTWTAEKEQSADKFSSP